MPDKSSKGGLLRLPDILDLNSACDFKNLLQERIEMGGECTLDGSKVARITTPAIQILLAYAKTLNSEARKPAIFNPSAALISAFNDIGLSGQLSQWSVS